MWMHGHTTDWVHVVYGMQNTVVNEIPSEKREGDYHHPYESARKECEGETLHH